MALWSVSWKCGLIRGRRSGCVAQPSGLGAVCACGTFPCGLTEGHLEHPLSAIEGFRRHPVFGKTPGDRETNRPRWRPTVAKDKFKTLGCICDPERMATPR